MGQRAGSSKFDNTTTSLGAGLWFYQIQVFRIGKGNIFAVSDFIKKASKDGRGWQVFNLSIHRDYFCGFYPFVEIFLKCPSLHIWKYFGLF